jgi:hypothetical protein
VAIPVILRIRIFISHCRGSRAGCDAFESMRPTRLPLQPGLPRLNFRRPWPELEPSPVTACATAAALIAQGHLRSRLEVRIRLRGFMLFSFVLISRWVNPARFRRVISEGKESSGSKLSNHNPGPDFFSEADFYSPRPHDKVKIGRLLHALASRGQFD